jgi:proteasome lid subunit RPN8/RPN11
MNNIEFDKKIKYQIKKECLKNKIEESCGLIFFDEKKYEFDIYPSKNIAKNKNNFFEISPREYLKCSLNYKIIGCYHSHIDENIEFSEFDKINSNKNNLIYVLYNIKYDKFNIYYANTKKNNYIGRPYITQISDCFSLVQDYLKNEAGINIWFPDGMSYPKSLKDIKGVYHNNFEEQGFLQLDKNTKLKKYDGIMVTYPNISEEYPSHCAIYLENDTILHQPYNSFSCVTIYDNLLKKYTSYILRHRSKV